MKAELKAKWLEALRSGDYTQGTGQLRNASDGYCCLGVLCDVAGVEWREKDVAANGYMAVWEGKDYGSCAPPSLFGNDDHFRQSILMNMNDTDGASFTAIADYIEENLNGA